MPYVAVGHDAHGVARVVARAAIGQQRLPGRPVVPGGIGRRHEAGTAAGSGAMRAEAGSSSSPASIMCRPVGHRPHPDRAVAGMTEPEGVDRVGDDQVEGPIGAGIEGAQGFGGVARVGMVQGLEHQLAAAALAGRRSERAAAVEHGRDQAVVVEPEPGAARPHVEARHGPAARSGQCRAGGSAARCAARRGWRPAAAATAQPGRRRRTSVHIGLSLDSGARARRGGSPAERLYSVRAGGAKQRG